ncbi:alpha/beta hydrolase [Williamsia sp. 1135]|uniref:alpha/beta fold hydrolase n=1 Tax=Williamsia sp. 1135 TaxID=1889262 RepID=UPI000A103FAE|nr:alpha/beta hydrolase [Williamsia sp. 1135]ORM27692.1 alpha/beta hydrolase [Williamsia sp. 1135]
MTGAPHHSTVRGARLAWTESGSGPPALWAHGLTASATGAQPPGPFDWSPLEGEHRLIRYDARAHGNSTGDAIPEQYTWPNLALDLLDLLNRAAGTEPASGIGASMGTATLLYAAVAQPGRFRRLVLTTPPTAGQTRARHVAGYRDGAALIEREGMAAFEAAAGPLPPVLTGIVQTPSPPSVPRSLLPSVLRGAALSDLPPAAALAAIDVPVLVLAWSGDDGHPLSTARYLAAIIPSARLVTADTPGQVRCWPKVVAAFLRT